MLHVVLQNGQNEWTLDGGGRGGSEGDTISALRSKPATAVYPRGCQVRRLRSHETWSGTVTPEIVAVPPSPPASVGLDQTMRSGCAVRSVAAALATLVSAEPTMVPSLSVSIETLIGTRNVEPRVRRPRLKEAVSHTTRMPTPSTQKALDEDTGRGVAVPPAQLPTRSPVAESSTAPPLSKIQVNFPLGKSVWIEAKNARSAVASEAPLPSV